MELTAADCHYILTEFRPYIGNYAWMWRLMRSRSANGQYFPDRMYRSLMRFGNPGRPFFIATTAAGTAFLGDYRDRYAAICSCDPDYNGTTIRFLQSKLDRARGAYLDIGANLGIIAATIARFLADRDEVVAFEPVAAIARRTAATFALNKLTNVRFLPIALGDSDGEISYYGPHADFTGGSVITADVYDQTTWRKSSVMCRRLNSLLEEDFLSQSAMMRIDMGCSDLAILKGADKLLKRDSPALLLERCSQIADHNAVSLSDMQAVLSTSGEYLLNVARRREAGDNPTLTVLPQDTGSSETVDIYCEPVRTARLAEEKFYV